MSHNALSSIDAEINSQFKCFSVAIKSNDLVSAKKYKTDLDVSFTERNAKCKELK